MERVSRVRPTAFHGASTDSARTPRREYALGPPFHLGAACVDPAHGRVFAGRLPRTPFFYGHAYDRSLEPAFVRRRNERERHRVRCVNEGYARLREHLPRELEDKRLSKVETLRAAIDYIERLQKALELGEVSATEDEPPR